MDYFHHKPDLRFFQANIWTFNAIFSGKTIDKVEFSIVGMVRQTLSVF